MESSKFKVLDVWFVWHTADFWVSHQVIAAAAARCCSSWMSSTCLPTTRTRRCSTTCLTSPSLPRLPSLWSALPADWYDRRFPPVFSFNTCIFFFCKLHFCGCSFSSRMFWSCWRSGSSHASPTVRSTCWAARRSLSTWSGSEPNSACRTTSPTTSSLRTGTPALRWVEELQKKTPEAAGGLILQKLRGRGCTDFCFTTSMRQKNLFLLGLKNKRRL